MDRGKRLMTGLRVLALVVALAVVGLGAWSKIIVHDIEVRNTSILEMVQLEPQTVNQLWREYFTAVLNGRTRTWISIAAASFASLASILIVLATSMDRLRISAALLVPIETLSMCAMSTAFGTSFSFALSLNTFSESRLNTFNSPDLTTFAILIPLSKYTVVAAGTGGFLVLVACIIATVDACNRARAKESCSFEPTASALGMGHENTALAPPMARSRVPSMYDPRRPLYTGPNRTSSVYSEEFEMRRRDSSFMEERQGSVDVEKETTGPLSLEKPHRVLQIRPSRPWSEVPVTKNRDGTVHAM